MGKVISPLVSLVPFRLEFGDLTSLIFISEPTPFIPIPWDIWSFLYRKDGDFILAFGKDSPPLDFIW